MTPTATIDTCTARKHGTASAYRRQKCRCPEAVTAKSVYDRRRRDRERPRDGVTSHCQNVEWLGMTLIHIAGTVTGDTPHPLTGWARYDAVRAMHALYHRPERIQTQLHVKNLHHLYQIGRRAGVELNPPDFVDEIGVRLVAGGAPLPLVGASRDELIRRLAPTRSCAEVAVLLCSTAEIVRRAGQSLGVQFVPVDCPRWRTVARPHERSAAA